MSMTLGRCTLTEDPYNMSMTGDRWSFSLDVVGVAQAGTVVDDMKAKIQQLRGLMDNVDEDVFPVTWSEDSSFDGFYRDFDVTIKDSPVMYANGFVPITVSMRRVAGAAAALFENTVSVVTTTNSHSLPTVSYAARFAVPYTNLEAYGGIRLVALTASSMWASSASSLTTDDGLVRVSAYNNFGNPPYTARYTWATTPALFYEGSAKVEQSFGGTYYPVHGQQILTSSTAWRLSNGLVRVSMSETKIQVSHYDGSAWDTAKEWDLTASSISFTLGAIKAVRVLRNTPQVVTVRVGVKDTASSLLSADLFITLRRGCRFASFTLLTSNYGVANWKISNGEAGTALTGGFRATSTDAAGNRYVVASPQAQTNTLATGTLATSSSVSTLYFCIGSEVGADGTGQTLINEYIDAVSEEQRVVSR